MVDEPSSSVELTLDEVRHIATLARIGMTEQELEKFRTDLSSILAHFDVLAAIDTEGVEPTNNGAVLLNIVAEDKARPSLTTDDVMANAPEQQDALFRVKAVLG